MAARHRTSVSVQPALPGLLERALAGIANAVLITDTQGGIVWVNQAICRLSGYAAHEAIGRSPGFLKSGQQDATFYRALWQTILAGNVWRGELVERHKDGSFYTVDEVITPLRDDAGALTHFVAIQHDITERQQRGAREHYLAYHDALTGLTNRALFLDVLEQAIVNAGRTRRGLALLYVDIDNFKSVNDTLGHHGGDRLLVAVAERLSSAVRKTDTVARIGGDEFAILQVDLLDTNVAITLARKLLHAVAQPFVLEDHKVYASVSIGIAAYPADGAHAADVLHSADLAMYRAKHLGRNRLCVYTRRPAPGAYPGQGRATDEPRKLVTPASAETRAKARN